MVILCIHINVSFVYRTSGIETGGELEERNSGIGGNGNGSKNEKAKDVNSKDHDSGIVNGATGTTGYGSETGNAGNGGEKFGEGDRTLNNEDEDGQPDGENVENNEDNNLRDFPVNTVATLEKYPTHCHRNDSRLCCNGMGKSRSHGPRSDQHSSTATEDIEMSNPHSPDHVPIPRDNNKAEVNADAEDASEREPGNHDIVAPKQYTHTHSHPHPHSRTVYGHIKQSEECCRKRYGSGNPQSNKPNSNVAANSATESGPDSHEGNAAIQQQSSANAQQETATQSLTNGTQQTEPCCSAQNGGVNLRSDSCNESNNEQRDESRNAADESATESGPDNRVTEGDTQQQSSTNAQQETVTHNHEHHGNGNHHLLTCLKAE